MSRHGKIARLPRGIREELNRRLHAGQEGDPLLAWLNPLPEVQTLLKEEFAGVPISKQNLSEWRKGGFVEWEFKGDCLWEARETAAESREVDAVTEGCLADHLAIVLAARYATLIRTWDGGVGEELRAKLKVLRGMIQDVTQLRRWDHDAAKLSMKQEEHEARREKTEAEVVKHFEGWIKRPAVQDWICKKWKTPVEREQEKRRLMGRPPLTAEEIAVLEGGEKSKNQNPIANSEEEGVGKSKIQNSKSNSEAEESKPVKAGQTLRQ